MVRTFLTAVIVVCTFSGTLTAQVKLTRKYAENSELIVRTESSTKQKLTIGPQDIETTSTQFLTIHSAIGKRMPDGTLHIAQKIQQMQTNLSLPGGIELSFDSGSPDTKADNPALEVVLDLFRATSKNQWTTILDKNNKIFAIEGRSKLLESLDQNLADVYKKQFDEKYLKDAANKELEQIPTKPIKKGDSWEITNTSRLEAGQSLTFTTRFEYLGTVEKDGKTLHKIEFAANKVSYDMDADSPSPLKIIESKLKPTSSKGHILFDQQKGHAVETVSKTRIQGEMKFKINDKEVPGKLDLTIEVKSTVE